MPRKFQTIDEALSTMKTGEIRSVRTGPGREGLKTIKKGEPMPKEQKFVPDPPARKARVIIASNRG